MGLFNRRADKSTCEQKRQSEGWVQARRVMKARTFSRSTRGMLRYFQCAARLPGRLTCQQEPCVRSARAGLSLRAQRSQETCRPEKWRPPGSQQIVGATESTGGASGERISAACWWLRRSSSNHPSPTERVLESRQREPQLPERFNTLDAVVPRRVCSAGVECS